MRPFSIASLSVLFCAAWLSGPLSAQTPKESVLLKGHTDKNRSLSWSGDGKLLASSCEKTDKTVRFWDVSTGKQKSVVMLDDELVSFVDLSGDGKMAVIRQYANNYTIVKIWDVDTGKEMAVLVDRDQRGLVFHLELHRDRKLVAIPMRHKDNRTTVTVWNANTGKQQSTLKGDFKYLDSTLIGFSEDGKLLATCCIGDVGLRLWDVTTGNEKPIAKAHLGDLRDFRFIEDGKSLICYTASKGELETHKWNVATGEKVTSKVAAGDAPLALSVDGKWVCSQRVLNKVGEYVLRNTITGEEKPATKLSDTLLLFHKLSPDGRYLVARGLRDDTLRVLDLHSCREVVVWKDVVLWAAGDLPHTPVVSFSPDSKMIAISSRDGTIRLWNLPEAKKNEK